MMHQPELWDQKSFVCVANVDARDDVFRRIEDLLRRNWIPTWADFGHGTYFVNVRAQDRTRARHILQTHSSKLGYKVYFSDMPLAE